jgi:hypothetical protein
MEIRMRPRTGGGNEPVAARGHDAPNGNLQMTDLTTDLFTTTHTATTHAKTVGKMQNGWK